MVSVLAPPMKGDATDWDEESYRDGIVKEREIDALTVFRTAWVPSHDPSPDMLAVATSVGSVASFSITSMIAKLGSGVGTTRVPKAEPQTLLHAHHGPVYDIKFFRDSEDTLLLSCGDDGRIRGWKWNEIASSDASFDLHENPLSPVVDLVNPQQKGPWGTLSPMPENNAIAVDARSGSIFSAAGDSCAYCWDLETCKIKMTFKGHSDYLHCVVARNSASQIITGSEDRTVRIWDCKSGKCVKTIAPEENKMNGLSLHISCAAIDANESWLAFSNCHGLALWNLPAMECASSACTRAPIYDALFDQNHIVAVGAESVVTHFDMNYAILSQIACAPCSAFSVSSHPSGVTAVGGCGSLVDIISPFGSHYCHFSCNCL